MIYDKDFVNIGIAYILSCFGDRILSGIRINFNSSRIRSVTAHTNSKETKAMTRQATARKQKSRSASENGKSHSWTFLTNHAHVLAVLNADPEKVLREVAIEVGITERAVQRIVQDLEEEGFIHRERIGRQNRYRILRGQPLRHPIEAHRKIGDLLKLISGE